MFCTHCGTKIDEGKKFCRNCGASTTKEAEPISAGPAVESDPTPPAAPVQAPPRSSATQVYDPVTRPPQAPAGAGRGVGKLIFIAAGIVVIVIGIGAGIYFGTDLVQQPVKQQETVAVQQPPPMTTEMAVPPPVEQPVTSEGTDSNVTSTVQSQPEPPPPLVEPSQPQREPTPKAPSETYAPKPPAPAAVQNPPPPAPAKRLPAPPPAIASRRPADPGTYETIRPTTVFEGPTESSRIVASIGSGIRVNVVGSNGDWLEVRSKTGKPPGFIRRDDAVLVARTN